MIFSISYTIIFGGIIFGIMHILKNKKKTFSNFQLISGYLNSIMSFIFLFIYIGESEILNTIISNPIIYIIFIIIVSYFYIFLAPISLGNILFSLHSKIKNRYYLILLNITSCIITTILVPLFLAWYN